MDAALILKQKFESGEITEYQQAKVLLERSAVLKELLQDFEINILNLLNRLTEIAEIPFTYKIGKVQKWINNLVELSFSSQGFSLNGENNSILACYHSMITCLLIRLKYGGEQQIRIGIDWILKYQNVARGLENKWSGSWAKKYGGCMKSTPCFIGLVKSMIALSEYKKLDNYELDIAIEEKLGKGLEYILSHELFKRKSSVAPITKYITKINYPFSYKTNLIEILKLLKDNYLDSDPRCDAAKDLLISKKTKSGTWNANSLYMPKYWVLFDKPGKSGDWISYEIEKLLRDPDLQPGLVYSKQ